MPDKEIVIRLKIPSTPRRSWLVLLIGLVLGAGAVAYATDFTPFGSGEALSSTKMNDNFTDLQTRIANLESGATPAGSPVAITQVQHVNGQAIPTTSAGEVARFTFSAPSAGVGTFYVSGYCGVGAGANMALGLSSSATACDPSSNGCPSTIGFNPGISSSSAVPYAIQASFAVVSGSNTFFVLWTWHQW